MPQSIKPPSIIDCIRHKQIFGSLPAFQSLNTWQAWLSWLKAIFAIPMTEDELAVYLQCTGRQEPPRTVPTEIYTICGRRGGKSFISSLTACFIACFSNFRRYLNAGERAAILILARDRDQAKIVDSAEEPPFFISDRCEECFRFKYEGCERQIFVNFDPYSRK